VRLLRLLADNDAKGIIDAIREIDEQFPNYSRMLEDLARDLQRIAVFQVVGTCDSENDLNEQEYAELSAALPIADVQLFYQIAIMGRRDLHLSPDPRSGAEMTLLRMLAFRPAEASEIPADSGGGGASVPGPKKAAQSEATRAAIQSRAPDPKQPSQTWQEPDWSALVATLGLTGAVRLLAINCVFLQRTANTIHLGLDRRSESLLTKQRKNSLAERLSSHFGESLQVDIEIGADEGETPVQEESRMADERMEAARQTLEADPNVQALKNMFGAELKTDSIELIKPSQPD